MAAGGRDRVTIALLSMPKMSARAIISSLPVVILNHSQNMAYKVYTAEALRIITVNTAKFAGGNYIKQKYFDLITPKQEEKRTGQDIVNMIKNKIAKIGSDPD